MKRICLLMVLGLTIWAIPSTAAATSCPDPIGGSDGNDRQYTVTGTGDTSVGGCVYGSTEPLDASSLNDINAFGGGWTSFCSTESDVSGNPNDTCSQNYGFVFNGTTSGTWSFTGVAGFEYAIGVKDGGSPKWAVFLLSDPNTSFAGLWSIISGNGSPVSLSHFVLYDRFVGTDGGGGSDGASVVPEPASLLLLGSGLALVARRVRRKK